MATNLFAEELQSIITKHKVESRERTPECRVMAKIRTALRSALNSQSDHFEFTITLDQCANSPESLEAIYILFSVYEEEDEESNKMHYTVSL